MTRRRKKSLSLPRLILLFVIIGGFLFAGIIIINYILRPESNTSLPVKRERPGDSAQFSGLICENLPRILIPLGIIEQNITYSRSDELFRHIKESLPLTRILIPESLSFFSCNLEVTKLVVFLGGEVEDALEDPKKNVLTLRITYHGKSTYLIILEKSSEIIAVRAKIAIIVDDMGIKNPALAEEFMKISYPLTMSILPFQRHTKKVQKLAKHYGREVLLHMPMEPQGYPEKNPGKGALLVIDSSDKLRTKITSAIENVDSAIGINNHMGSRATEYEELMATVIETLKEHGLFFIDSRTSSQSVGYETAKQLGLPTARVDLFLDNVDDVNAIIERLDESAEIALSKGMTVVICHDKLSTLEALKNKMPLLAERGIQFVSISKLIE